MTNSNAANGGVESEPPVSVNVGWARVARRGFSWPMRWAVVGAAVTLYSWDNSPLAKLLGILIVFFSIVAIGQRLLNLAWLGETGTFVRKWSEAIRRSPDRRHYALRGLVGSPAAWPYMALSAILFMTGVFGVLCLAFIAVSMASELGYKYGCGKTGWNLGFLCMFPIFWLARRSYDKAITSVALGLVGSSDDLVLYLRPFGIDQRRLYFNIQQPGVSALAPRFEGVIAIAASRFGNVVKLDNRVEKHSHAAVPLSTQDGEWYDVFTAAAKKARRIVLVPSNSSGLLDEVGFLVSARMLERVIVVEPPPQSEIETTAFWTKLAGPVPASAAARASIPAGHRLIAMDLTKLANPMMFFSSSSCDEDYECALYCMFGKALVDHPHA